MFSGRFLSTSANEAVILKFASMVAALALVVGALASADSVSELIFGEHSSSKVKSEFYPTPIHGCLYANQAKEIVEAFNYLLANPNATNFAATADQLFSSDFTDTSDSINQLAGIPMGGVTFDNKQDFIEGSGAQPPLILDSLDYFWSCHAISWRWVSVKGAGNDATPIKGIDNFSINSKGQIQSVYAEFNNGAWLANLGYPECSSS